MSPIPMPFRFYGAMMLAAGVAASCTTSSPGPSSTPGGVGGQIGIGTGGQAGGSGGQSGAGGATGTGGGVTPGTGGNTTPPDGSTDVPQGAGVTPDAASDGSASCSLAFCDDFERYAAGSAPAGSWRTAMSRGTLAVDEMKAFSGARSVRFTHQGAPAQMFIELRQPVLPLPGKVTHGRLMYYITKSPTGQFSHFEIVRGGGPLATGGRAQLNTGGENGKVVINYEPGDCTKYSKVDFPEKRWTCYQWRFDVSTNDIHEWVDGVSADDIPVTIAGTCWRAPTAVDTLHIGWQSYHSEQPVELWIDDVAVGDQPIPCPTASPSKP